MVNWFAFQEVYSSRLTTLAALLYSNVYGVFLIFQARGQHVGIVGPFNTMGFGQIVPVFLLASLLFALVESYYGMVCCKYEITPLLTCYRIQNRQGRTSTAQCA